MSIEITTTSLITGSSNTDGTGGAENLTVENGHEIDLSHYTDYQEDLGGWKGTIIDGNTTIVNEFDHHGYYKFSITNTADWNDDGQKEISVDMEDFAYQIDDSQGTNITIDNFVDVNFHAVDIDCSGELFYTFEGIKRGTIDFSDNTERSNIVIHTQSNGASWGNTVEVTGSEYTDIVSISGYEGTEYTEFSVDLGGGNDEFSSYLDPAKSADQTRFVDGGDGVDTISLHDTEAGTLAEVDFVNFEIITANDYELTLNEYVLSHNGTQDAPLIVEGAAELNFSGDVESITATEYDYVNDHGVHKDGYYEVTVDYDDASYTIISDNVDDAWLV